MPDSYHTSAEPAGSLAPNQTLINVTHAVYALQAAAFFIGLSYIAAIILNYVKLDDVRGTWLDSHFRWQIRTFWWSLAWFVLGTLATVILIGYVILTVAAIWVIYRIIKGWLRLSERKPMYVV